MSLQKAPVSVLYRYEGKTTQVMNRGRTLRFSYRDTVFQMSQGYISRSAESVLLRIPVHTRDDSVVFAEWKDSYYSMLDFQLLQRCGRSAVIMLTTRHVRFNPPELWPVLYANFRRSASVRVCADETYCVLIADQTDEYRGRSTRIVFPTISV